ncbi:hypothetical protein GCM10023168_17900 [Fodinibacter luteus]|uniref:Inosine/uridine-preferring nucleoside hydrolase domain-containing protein n=1 Tax=Fodinibacter luteus TaxID=552064 RepID=A0ABP8KFB9_9MICO
MAALAAGALLSGCAAPADLDGEVLAAGPGAAPAPASAPAPPRVPGAPAVPLVVDTDLGADDVLALAFLLRSPEVDVRAVTVAATGLVRCEPGVDVVAGLFSALGVEPVPVACGRADPGPAGRAFPAAWRSAAEAGSGVTPVPGTPVGQPAADLLAEQARDVPGLVLVAIGPMTNVADLAARHPDDYVRLTGIHAMAGSVSGPPVDGVAEWNAAADPESLTAVLTSSVPVTVVPADAVPTGTPAAALAAPVVGRVAAASALPSWWDLAAAAALVTPDAGTGERGGWRLDPSEPGRLRRSGAGTVTVHRSLGAPALEAQYTRVFRAS